MINLSVIARAEFNIFIKALVKRLRFIGPMPEASLQGDTSIST